MWILLLFFFLFTNPVHAQEATISAQTATPIPTVIPTPTPDPKFVLFEQYKTDYLFQLSLYQKAYIDYIDKSQVHTKYGTLTSQQDQLNATKNTLIVQNTMFKSYLTALRVDLDKYKSSNQTATLKNQINLSKWEEWFNEQNQIIPSFNDESSVSNWVQDFNKQFIPIQVDIYTALVQHQVNQQTEILNNIKSLASFIQTTSKVSSDDQQWFNNLPIKSDLVLTSLQNALDLSQTKQNLNKFNNFYQNSRNELNKANGYLTGMLKDLKSIVLKLE